MTPAQDTLTHIDKAIARFDQALEALRQIPKQGQLGAAVNGIEHELMAIAKRLQSLRDEVAGEGDRGE